MEPKFKVGDRVRITGDKLILTTCINGKHGTIVAVYREDPIDYGVRVDDDPMWVIPWRIWEYNLTKIEEEN